MQDRVCSTLFSVQIGHILTFFSKSQSPIPNDRIRNICRVLYMLDDNMLIHGTKKKQHKSTNWESMALLKHTGSEKKGKHSPASSGRKRYLSKSSERPGRCQRSPLRKKDKNYVYTRTSVPQKLAPCFG